MNTLTHLRSVAARVAIGAALVLAFGCTPDSRDRGASAQPVVAGEASAAAHEKSGARLWSENCTRCHYSRPPTQYSAQQWDIIMTHMRLRANLTGPEQREITQFLQSGS